MPGSALALEIGTLTHQHMAAKLLPRASVTLQDHSSPEWQRLKQVLDLWEKPSDWDVLASEEPMELQLGPHTIDGTPDAIIKWNDQYWHGQIKTAQRRLSVYAYVEQQTTDWHEIGYERMISNSLGVEVNGTILILIRKPEPFDMGKGDEHLRSLVSLHYLTRSARIVSDGLKDLEAIVDQIEAQYIEQSGGLGYSNRIIRNRSACAGANRNYVCQYKRVCDHEAEITDGDYVDVPDRYATKE
jgi:hypothetical protein